MSTPHGTRRRAARRSLLVGTGVLLLLTVAVLDVAGVLRPLPPAADLVRRAAEQNDRLVSYRADVAVQRGTRDTGLRTQHSRQWVLGRDRVALAIKDETTFVHFEEWEPGLWRYHQAGLEKEWTIRLVNEEKPPYWRWGMSRFPTVGDLVQALAGGAGHRVTGRETVLGAECFRVEFQPVRPQATPGSFMDQFYSEYFGRNWTMWLARTTGLPVRCVLPATAEHRVLTIRVSDWYDGQGERPEDWKRVNEAVATVKKRVSLQVDAASAESLQRVLGPLGTEINAWKRSRYPAQADPTQPLTGSGP